MRPEEIVGIIKNNLSLGLVILAGIIMVFLFGYFLVYKKILGGKKKISLRNFIVYGGFGLYILMVLGVTLLDRGSSFSGNTNLHFLSSYREAWNSGSVRAWQMQILNIIMFMPFGFMLPLVNKKYRKFSKIFLASLLFTLFIEITQLITGLGIFELDDLFNNILGGILGYCIVMGIISLFSREENKGRKLIKYMTPLLIFIIFFSTMYFIYDGQEFGNLEEKYSYKKKMKEIELVNNLELDEQRGEATIYSGPKYNKLTGREYVEEKFKKLGIDTRDMEVIQYSKDASYRVSGEESYHIWLQYLDGSYSFIDFSAYKDESKIKDIDEEDLKIELKKFDIDIPNFADYKKEEDSHIWSVDKYIDGDSMINGSISCQYYEDGIKKMDNSLIEYKKVKNIPIISQKEAYDEIENGRFKYYTDDIKKIEIKSVDLDYRLDSKGYYQPVYLFDLLIDGEKDNLVIEAME